MNNIFTVLVIAGMMLIGVEVFIPGGVLGTLGAVALLAAAIIAFQIFSPSTATAIAFGMIVMAGGVIALWIRFFPRTSIGRKMTVSLDLMSSKGTEAHLPSLLGKTGVTLTPLRPAGYVDIDGHRIDVVTHGEMIEMKTRIRVTAIEGNRVVVEPLE